MESNVYKQVNEIDMAAALTDPLTSMEQYSKLALQCNPNNSKALLKGAYKQKVSLTFEVADIAKFRIPSAACMQVVATGFDIIWLYQHQAVAGRFDLYVVAHGWVRCAAIDLAVIHFAENMCGGKDNLKNLSVTKLVAQRGGVANAHSNVRQRMLMTTGYNLQLQLLDLNRLNIKKDAREA